MSTPTSMIPYPGGQNPLLVSDYGFSGLGSTPSPFFTVSGQFNPRDFKSIIKWTRFLAANSPLTTEVIRKLSSYPITEFILDTEDEKLKKQYKQLFKHLDLKARLIDIGVDFHLLANVWVSVYFPFIRWLTCSSCKSQHQLSKFSNRTLQFRNWEFRGVCPTCGESGVFKRHDVKSPSMKGLSIINWDPEDISLIHNPVSNQTQYWYKVPGKLRGLISQGDLFTLESIPWSFVDAVRKNEDYCFDREGIFHLKGHSVANAIPGYGVPPIVGTYGLAFDAAMMRRANSAIASEQISPLRVIFPQPAGKDPATAMSLQNFSKNMKRYMLLHKADPSVIAMTPIPVGYQQISGEGKAMLVSQEIEQIQEELLLSLGVSRELLSGTLNWTSSTVGLRLLENTMWKYIDSIQRLLDWLIEQITPEFNLEPVQVTFEPFKLTDNDEKQSMMFQLSQTQNVSAQSMLSSMGLDWHEEMQRIRDEQVEKAKQDVLVKRDIDIAQYVAAQGAADTDSEESAGYKTALQQAQETANQLIGMAEGPRRSALSALKVQDPALYLMTAKLIEEYRSDPSYQSNVAQQGQQIANDASQQNPQSNQQPGQPGY